MVWSGDRPQHWQAVNDRSAAPACELAFVPDVTVFPESLKSIPWNGSFGTEMTELEDE
jgi:hypothetical protein